MKFFALPLAVLLLQDAESLEIVSKHKHKKAFVEKVKAARNNLGDVSRRLSGNDRLIAKSIHTPGLRSEQRTAQSASASVPKTKTNDPTSKLEADESARQLYWWNWWKRSNATEGEEQAEEAGCEGEDCDMYDNNNQTSGTWWSNYGWNNWNNKNGTQEDDIWSDGTNTSYVTESLRDFSIKYSGCRSLTSFMSVEDESDTSPLITQNFATYRLCPSESCSDDSWNGCKSVYGEYMMSIEDFLTIQEDYLLEAFEQQCEYCENCMYFETWYSGKYYNNNGDRKLNNDHACAAYDACYDYEDYCSDEAQQEAEEESGVNLEEFFGCEKVQFDISSNNGNNNNNNNGEEDEQDNGDGDDTIQFDDQVSTGMYEMVSGNDGVAYIGTHCLDGELTLGLFADENCAQYIGHKIGSYNETESIAESANVVDMYIPQGCMGCDGNNLVSSNYYVPDGDKEAEEYQEAYENDFEDYVSDICSNMYLESAKCHSHLSEDDMSLELSDSELEVQELTCDFIEDVVKGYVSEDGLVNSHDNQGNFIGDFFQAFGGDYNGDPEGKMTGAQGAALFLTGAASVAMGAAAYHLKTKVDAGLSDGLIANDAAVST